MQFQNTSPCLYSDIDTCNVSDKQINRFPSSRAVFAFMPMQPKKKK